jgi:hypothetical protein
MGIKLMPSRHTAWGLTTRPDMAQNLIIGRMHQQKTLPQDSLVEPLGIKL